MDFFIQQGEYIELKKLLKAASLVQDGGQAKAMIVDGLVRVDGEVETRKGRKLYPGQIVEIENEKIFIKK